MLGHYSYTPHRSGINEVIERVMADFEKSQREMDAALSTIKTCPGPCADQTVEISLPGKKPYRTECPIASRDCHYGARLTAILDSFLIGLMSNIGVPVRHLDNITSSVGSVAIKSAESWQRRGFLVLTGIPGVGKSFAAARAIKSYLGMRIDNWFARRNWEAAATAAESIVWASAKETVDDKLLAGRIRSCQLAALDDLGKEDDTRTGVAAVRDVITKRYDAKLPTIITSELTLLDIQNRYGRYIAERLVEDYCSKIVDCGGESFRLREAAPHD